MAQTPHWLRVNLQRFADGGSAASGDGAAATGETARGDAAPAPAGGSPALRTKRGTPIHAPKPSGQGRETGAARGRDVAGRESESGEETYESLIKGKYKALYDADVSAIVQNRLKNARASADTLAKLAPVLEALGRKYSLDTSDLSRLDVPKLTQALAAEESGRAGETGKPAPGAREAQEAQKTFGEQSILHERDRALREAHDRALFTRIARQAAEAKAVYPGLDIRAELASPDFRRLVTNGVPVRSAYEVAHMGEILSGAMQYTAKKVAQSVANSIQSGTARPAENGARPQQASVTTEDIRSKAFRDQIKARVRLGERVVL